MTPDPKQRRKERIILLVAGVPLLLLIAVMIWFGQTPELPLYVVHDGEETLELTACSTTATVPPRTRMELRVRCLFGGGEVIVKGDNGAPQKESFADAAPTG